jgi:hypothetical protein
MTLTMSSTPAHRIGAVAGLAPATAVPVFLLVLGATPSSVAPLWVAIITIVAVGAGWLIGPRATGSFRSDLWATVAYALVGSFAYILVGTAVSIWTGPPTEGDVSPAPLVARLAGQLLYGLLYLPFWAGLGAVLAISAVAVSAGSVWARRDGTTSA